MITIMWPPTHVSLTNVMTAIAGWWHVFHHGLTGLRQRSYALPISSSQTIFMMFDCCSRCATAGCLWQLSTVSGVLFPPTGFWQYQVRIACQIATNKFKMSVFCWRVPRSIRVSFVHPWVNHSLGESPLG